MQKIYVTACDAKTVHRSKVMAQTVVFMFLVTLTVGLCSICCLNYWNLHAKFHKNPLSING